MTDTAGKSQVFEVTGRYAGNENPILVTTGITAFCISSLNLE
jgi:hypothetical protein